MIYDQKIGANVQPVERKSIKMATLNALRGIKDGISFRVAQDEICIVLKDAEKAAKVFEDLRSYFANPEIREQLRFNATGWLFMADLSELEKGEDLQRLINYLRNGNRRFDENSVLRTDGAVVREMYNDRDMENLVEESVELNRLEVFYQPIYSNDSHRIHSAEALVRIRRENGRLVPPGEFIELSEKNGMIVQIGERVFEEVCKLIHEEKLDKKGIDYIEINLSVVQACRAGLAERFISIMREYEIKPSMINLEITETATNDQRAILMNNMELLLDYGVHFSLDDFGTCQSNLSYIVDMPVEIIKFDRTLINAYFEGGKARFVMEAAMQMIKNMDLSIVAEGIETKDQLEEMQKLGIKFIQGYYFSKPLSRNDFLQYLGTL